MRLRNRSVIAVVSARDLRVMVGLLGRARGFSTARSQPAPARVATDLTAAQLAALTSELHCDAPPDQAYGEAIERFRGGTAVVLPARPVSHLGRLLTPRDHREQVAYAVLAPSGVTTGEVTPDNPDEERQLAEIRETLRAGGEIAPAHPVAVFVAGLANPNTTVHPGATVGSSLIMETSQERRFWQRTAVDELVIVYWSGDRVAGVGVF